MLISPNHCSTAGSFALVLLPASAACAENLQPVDLTGHPEKASFSQTTSTLTLTQVDAGLGGPVDPDLADLVAALMQSIAGGAQTPSDAQIAGPVLSSLDADLVDLENIPAAALVELLILSPSAVP